MKAEHARVIRNAIKLAHSDMLMGTYRDYPQYFERDTELFQHAYRTYRIRHDIKPLTENQLTDTFGWPAEAFDRRPWDERP